MPTKKHLKLKKNVLYIGIFTLIGLSLTLYLIYFGLHSLKQKKYQETNEYKLIQLGYTEEESTTLLNHFTEEEIKTILENKKNENLIALIKEKYYLKKNLEKYLSYLEKNKNTSIKDAIVLVNVHRDNNYYTNTIKTDQTKGILLNVNKYYYLDKDDIPENLEKISIRYSYEGNQLIKEANEAFYTLCKDAEKEGFIFIVNLSYRSYEGQENSYKKTRIAKGEREADKTVARPGHSDHQTGLSVNLKLKNTPSEQLFEETEGYKWLQEHAHEYGFIERYPKEKENITGFPYESSHFRYVGTEAAANIKNENITFDEYYAFYIEK